MAADEGSTGFALFLFMASHLFRILFHRDPCHRLSNVFIQTLQAVPAVMKVTMDLLLCFKFRRAPLGGGRFWKETAGSLTVFNRGAGAQHPLLEQLRESICRDLDIPVEATEADPTILQKHFDKASRIPIGIRSKLHSVLRHAWCCCLVVNVFFDAIGHLLSLIVY